MATLRSEVAQQVTRDIRIDGAQRVSPSKASLVDEFLKKDKERGTKAGQPLELAAPRRWPAHIADLAAGQARAIPGQCLLSACSPGGGVRPGD